MIWLCVGIWRWRRIDREDYSDLLLIFVPGTENGPARHSFNGPERYRVSDVMRMRNRRNVSAHNQSISKKKK